MIVRRIIYKLKNRIITVFNIFVVSIADVSLRFYLNYGKIFKQISFLGIV